MLWSLPNLTWGLNCAKTWPIRSVTLILSMPVRNLSAKLDPVMRSYNVTLFCRIRKKLLTQITWPRLGTSDQGTLSVWTAALEPLARSEPEPCELTWPMSPVSVEICEPHHTSEWILHKWWILTNLLGLTMKLLKIYSLRKVSTALFKIVASSWRLDRLTPDPLASHVRHQRFHNLLRASASLSPKQV